MSSISESEGKATVFTKEGPGSFIDKSEGGILSNPELLWIEDEWTEERVVEAQNLLQLQLEKGTAPNKFWKEKYQSSADKYWFDFYRRNKTNFYKDRHYLHIVFPELAPADSADGGVETITTNRIKLLEVGCGVGNAVLPLLDVNPKLDIVCIDFAKSAISLLQKEIDEYQLRESLSDVHNCTELENITGTEDIISGSSSAVGANSRVIARVCDVVKDDIPVPDNSLDLILCMFVISAISPLVSYFFVSANLLTIDAAVCDFVNIRRLLIVYFLFIEYEDCIQEAV